MIALALARAEAAPVDGLAWHPVGLLAVLGGPDAALADARDRAMAAQRAFAAGASLLPFAPRHAVPLAAAARFAATAPERLAARIDGLADMAELALMVAAAAPVPAAASGRAFLAARAEMARGATALLDGAGEWATRAGPVKAAGGRWHRALLVSRAQVAAVQAAVAALPAPPGPPLALAVTGPWPPYSFAEAA